MDKLNPIDTYAVIQKLQKEDGWQVVMDKIAEEGNEIMSQLLDVNLEDTGQKYTKRDLLVYQLYAMGVIGRILASVETEAKNESIKQKEKQHKGN